MRFSCVSPHKHRCKNASLPSFLACIYRSCSLVFSISMLFFRIHRFSFSLHCEVYLDMCLKLITKGYTNLTSHTHTSSKRKLINSLSQHALFKARSWKSLKKYHFSLVIIFAKSKLLLLYLF